MADQKELLTQVSLTQSQIRERLASVETSLRVLVKTTNDGLDTIQEQVKDLNATVNHKVSRLDERITSIERNDVRSKTEWVIWKKAILWTFAGLGIGGITLLFSYIGKVFLGI